MFTISVWGNVDIWSGIGKTMRKTWFVPATVKCYYNAAKHDIFHTPLHWLSQNINNTLDSQETLHSSPWSVCCEDFGGNWPRYNCTALYIDGLVQEWRNSSALSLSCINPSICTSLRVGDIKLWVSARCIFITMSAITTVSWMWIIPHFSRIRRAACGLFRFAIRLFYPYVSGLFLWHWVIKPTFPTSLAPGTSLDDASVVTMKHMG